jgi:hypothetical protein
MVRQTSLRAAALIIFATFLTTIQSSNAQAQTSDDVEMLRRQVQQLGQASNYVEAFTLQRRLAAEIEKGETASAGKPGARTASALTSVAWYALLAHDFKQALASSDRAHALAPTSLYAESNRPPSECL